MTNVSLGLHWLRSALLMGSLLELSGLNLYTIQIQYLPGLPGGLFGLIFPIWLIVKGFNSSTIASESANLDDGGWSGVRQPTAASKQGAENSLH